MEQLLFLGLLGFAFPLGELRERGVFANRERLWTVAFLIVLVVGCIGVTITDDVV